MSLDWGREHDTDEGRLRRLAASYGVAFAIVAGLLVLGVVFGGRIKKQVLEEEVDVKFVAEKKPEPPPPPPPPPPKPMPKIRAASQAPPPPLGVKVDAPPTEIPKQKPLESDPSKAVPEAAAGDPNGCVGCTGKPGGGGGLPAPTAPPPVPVLRPYQITEVTTPPIALAKAMPAFPDEARRQGVDMVVVVKFVVTETGEVEDVKVIDGHPALDAAVIEAVKKWRFTPGTLDGKNVRVVRKMKFPFHLRTAN